MYYIELISVFMFFLLFGAIFSPFLGGCLILFSVLFILGSLIVFFSLNFVWFIAAALIVYLTGFITKFYRWYKLPEYAAYVASHPQCRQGDVITCYKCGSDKTIHQGLLNRQSGYRYYICAVCRNMLFRFKVL